MVGKVARNAINLNVSYTGVCKYAASRPVIPQRAITFEYLLKSVFTQQLIAAATRIVGSTRII